MKKLLLVLLVAALASFLFVGCLPVTPAEGEGEGEGEVEGACPTVSITSEVEIDGKKYIKGAAQTITVTFAVATEPVSVYVADAIKDNPAGVPNDAVEIVMYPDADKKVWTGKHRFGTAGMYDCSTGYIYVTTCATCAPCKFAYTVDEEAPCSLIKLYEGTNCSCGGFDIVFKGGKAADTCITCCNDYCTGLDEYTIDLYKTNPFDICCDVPCASTIASCSGSGCDIDCTMSCVDISAYTTADTKDFYLVATLKDKVGNSRRYYAIVNIDSDDILTVTEYRGLTQGGLCTNWTTAEAGTPQTINPLLTAGYYADIGGCAIDIYGNCSDTPDEWL